MKAFSLSLIIILLAFLSAVATDEQVDKDTVLLMTFSENEGKVVKDGSGNNNDGKIAGKVNWTKGLFGTALEFLGDKGKTHVTVRKLNNFDFSGVVTIEAWVKPIALSGWANIVEIDYQLGFKFGFFNKHPVFTIYRMKDCIAQGEVPLNQWSYVAATFDGEEANIYINGKLDSNIKFRFKFSRFKKEIEESPLEIGWQKATGRHFFNGAIDELRISRVVRTADEIKHHWLDAPLSLKYTM